MSFSKDDHMRLIRLLGFFLDQYKPVMDDLEIESYAQSMLSVLSRLK